MSKGRGMHGSRHVPKLFCIKNLGTEVMDLTDREHLQFRQSPSLFVCALLRAGCITQIQDTVTYLDTAVTNFEVNLWIYC